MSEFILLPKERPKMDHIEIPGLGEGLPLGRQIRVARTLRGLKQQDLAAAAGIAANTLSRIENGANKPDADTLLAIVSALGYRVVIYLGVGSYPHQFTLEGWRDPSIPALVKARREERKWTQLALAAVANVGRTTVATLETGTQLPDEDTLLAILNALWDNQVRVALEPVGE